MDKFKSWCSKIYEALKPPPSQRSIAQQLVITLGSTITICLLYLLNHLLGKENLLLLVPFVVSALMIFTMPTKSMTSAGVILQSYLLCSLIGFAFVYVFDYAQWVMVAAFATCFSLMLLLECLHPPAIILPILIISERLRDYTLAFNPIALDVLVLLITTYLFNKVLMKFLLVKK
ncbi:HPP family protein [Polynucleobacter sp. AP-Nickl1-40-C4]|uniref:HPP family protein n=1 Tax=Polynucleobacter sp. AP-Nickl1-40-C4 TaxID=3108275 RepID=UPI002B236A6F|nr:HPP family protein [Polynucleobacter sp. AP-Nickl1-40-C4]MEA9569032.1 HPP family protein [Polynucleobacter sp. AP-Nickl1-40-C4]